MNNQRLGPSGSEMSSSPPSTLDGGRPTCEWVQGITCVGWLGCQAGLGALFGLRCSKVPPAPGRLASKGRPVKTSRDG